MTRQQTNDIDNIMQTLIEQGPDAMANVFTRLMNMAMHAERQQFLNADPYQRSPDRRAHANGYKPKTLDTPAGTVTVNVPKTRNHGDQPFYPQSLEHGTRSSRAVMAAVAEMYVQGVSTRDVHKVFAELGVEQISSAQVSRANAMLDEELQAWRRRDLGEIRYLQLDARYEKVREAGVVVDAAVLSAVGIGPDGHRRVLGVSVALSEAEVHWRQFLESLVERGLQGLRMTTSDHHSGLQAARQAIWPGVPWQRCQFHLAQNAIQHSPTAAIRGKIGGQLRQVFNAGDLHEATRRLDELVKEYLNIAPKLASWLEKNIPQGLTVLALPSDHRRKMRTTNGVERPIQQELKRRTRKVRVFPNAASLLRLTSAVLVEIDEQWSTTDKRYLTWEDSMAT